MLDGRSASWLGTVALVRGRVGHARATYRVPGNVPTCKIMALDILEQGTGSVHHDVRLRHATPAR